jgi:hypothetical protein
LLNALQGYKARDLRDQARSDQANLGQQYHQRLQQGLEDYVKPNVPGQTLSDGQAGALLSNDQAPGPLKEPGYDPHKAAAMAVGSGIPELKQIGMEDFKAMAAALRKSQEPETFNHQPVPGIDKSTGDLAFLLTGNKGGKKILRDVVPPAENIVVNNQVIDKNNPTKVRADYSEGFGDPYKIGEDWFQKDTRGKVYKLDQSPRTTIHNIVNTGDDAFMKKLGGDTAEMVTEARKGKQASQGMLVTAQRLSDLDKRGVFSGPTANMATAVSAYADALGLPVDQNKLSNSQQYVAELGAQVAKVLTAGAGVGRSMTDADRQAFMSQFPQLISTQQGRSQIIQLIQQEAAYRSQYSDKIANNLRANYPEAYKLFNVAPTDAAYPVNPTPTPPAGAQSQSRATPAIPLTNSRGWRLHRDDQGNAAYVSPDGEQFQEVK